MKNFSLFIFLLLFLGSQIEYATAQHEYDIWYFGTNAGLDFTGGAPVNLTDGQVNTVEGNAAISDNAGNLLFYTDGVTVWNKLHNMMTNGNGLSGGESSTQSALILPLPGSDSLYYVFTVGELFNSGLRYSIVDMSLQSGNGEVTDKNILLLDNTTEKLTAARDSNNIDYWIVTHQTGNKRFYAFKFTALGISSTPVISIVGTTHNSEIGYMKCSHNSSKIAVAVHSDFFFELFDFDNATGVVSNPIYLTPPASSLGPYGLEFSPNDSLLYGTVYTPGIIAQWDISSNDESIINASLNTNTSANVYAFGLQLAPDGKIYLAKYLDDYLGVINNPDVYGSGCDYIDYGFDLSPKQSQGGLPNIFPGFFGQSGSPGPLSNFSVPDPTICQKFCTDYLDQSTNNPTSWLWEFEGGSPPSSLEQNPAGICYNTPGIYDVTLTTTNANGTNTLTFQNFITVYPTPPFPAITQAGYTLTSSPATFYQWQLNSADIPGATDQSYTVIQSGLYTVVVEDSNGCQNSASIKVFLVGIEDVTEDANISIYPNPTSGNFIVEFSYAKASENGWLEIKVVNTLGQIVFSSQESRSFRNADRKMEIDLSDVPRGIYFVGIKKENDIIRKKIVIAH